MVHDTSKYTHLFLIISIFSSSLRGVSRSLYACHGRPTACGTRYVAGGPSTRAVVVEFWKIRVKASIPPRRRYTDEVTADYLFLNYLFPKWKYLRNWVSVFIPSRTMNINVLLKKVSATTFGFVVYIEFEG